MAPIFPYFRPVAVALGCVELPLASRDPVGSAIALLYPRSAVSFLHLHHRLLLFTLSILVSVLGIIPGEDTKERECLHLMLRSN